MFPLTCKIHCTLYVCMNLCGICGGISEMNDHVELSYQLWRVVQWRSENPSDRGQILPSGVTSPLPHLRC